MTTKPFFDAARVIAGGKLTQAQVDELNKVVEKLAPGGKTTSDVGINLISGFEDTLFKAYDDGVGGLDHWHWHHSLSKWREG